MFVMNRLVYNQTNDKEYNVILKKIYNKYIKYIIITSLGNILIK